ncbi:hypothetical protein SK128_003007 [Halocaridina rubra]|uniref:G-protein coupled receptors family 1 profile domain-containing protein n=1 Tax=Halocaridina rubra TaxID=373956 RepID=A0AAN9FUP7_HALRR
MCMGVYLLIIASVDVSYRGVYFIYDAVWRTSPYCQLAGFLSTFSSELSVFSLTGTLITSFLILSLLVTPHIHLNILISATSSFFSCVFFIAHVSAPYIIAGLTTVLCTLPLNLIPILLSHSTPDTFFQFFHPACILWNNLVIASR